MFFLFLQARNKQHERTRICCTRRLWQTVCGKTTDNRDTACHDATSIKDRRLNDDNKWHNEPHASTTRIQSLYKISISRIAPNLAEASHSLTSGHSSLKNLERAQSRTHQIRINTEECTIDLGANWLPQTWLHKLN